MKRAIICCSCVVLVGLALGLTHVASGQATESGRVGAAAPAAGVSARLVQRTEAPNVEWPITLKWQRCPTWYCETGWYASPAVADLDKDGQAEVYWGGYTLMAVNGADGTIRWSASRQNSARLWPGIVAADIDNDGNTEVVTANGGGIITAYGAGLAVKPGWPVNPTGSGNEIRSLAVSDLDNNGAQEVVVCSTRSDNQWFVYGSNGVLRTGWPRMTDSNTDGYAAGCYNENVGVADVDGDGRAEIIGPNDTHYVTAFHDDGSALLASPIYGLINGKQKPWARVGLHVDHQVDLRGYANCGSEHRPNMANSAPTIADVDGDGTPEIIIVGNVYNCGTDPYTDLYEMPFILNADRTRWKAGAYDWTVIPTPDAAAAPISEDYNEIENNVPNPVVVDLDGDGQREILYPSYDGRLHAYWLDKSEHGGWPYSVYEPVEGIKRFASEPVVVDLDNDGKAEVIVASWTQNGSGKPGKLLLLSWDGRLLQSIDLPYEPDDQRGGSLAAPTLANIDGDADLELVVGTINKGLVAYDIGNSAGARVLWGTGRGGYQRTGAAPAGQPAAGSLAGSYKAIDNLTPQAGQVVTYTIRLNNPGQLLPTARVTDTLPGNATLAGDRIAATSGSLAVAGGALLWSGAVTGTVASGGGVTITYAMTVSADLPTGAIVANTVAFDSGFDSGAGSVYTQTSSAVVSGLRLNLPFIRK